MSRCGETDFAADCIDFVSQVVYLGARVRTCRPCSCHAEQSEASGIRAQECISMLDIERIKPEIERICRRLPVK